MLALCVEASHQRGMGHLFRMMNLITYLRAHERPYIMLVNEHAPSLGILRGAHIPCEVVSLDDLDSDWESRLIKHYGVTVWVNDRLDTHIRHAENVKRQNIKLVTFDDKGSGAAAADVHIAALVFDGVELLQGKKILSGIEYLILNPDIDKFKRRRIRVERIIVTLGGSDTYGVTVRIAELLKKLGRTAAVHVGPGFERHDSLMRVMNDGFELKAHVPSLVQEFARYDLAITGGGITAFEANASGLPSIIVANETFEIPVGRFLERLGCSVFAGHHSAIDETAFERPLDIETMSLAGMRRIPTNGVHTIYRELYS